ncbi:hypothetical protein Q75_04960 [Bacillus coahuilensis p1.1.43]|uniref:YueH-like protein n=1 Tax=Bacillus coahuilensis p1.1.43 TaxID=1150625 RepID=A0A147KA53_9BACI|nr:YueH family protein [Bacillus coahuilensis]KUP07585.1 hypothetical protein Q75_04960 [Bacillus coahuilensis p1.1.43]
MKTRKSVVDGHELKIFLHENKKEELVLIAIPELEWSYALTYEEISNDFALLTESRMKERGIDSHEAAGFALRLLQWIREM